MDAIKVVQFPIKASKGSLNSQKIAKMSTEKGRNILNKYQKELAASLSQAQVVRTTEVNQVSLKKDYSVVAGTFNLVCYESPNRAKTSGARKLKVNPIVSNCAKDMYNNSNIVPAPKVEAVVRENVAQVGVEVPQAREVEVSAPSVSYSTNNSVNNFSRLSRLESIPAQNEVTAVPLYNAPKEEPFTVQRPTVAPLEVEKAPVVEKEVSPSVSIDDYLQQGVPKEEDSMIVQLSQDNERLKDEIVKSQKIVEEFEKQLQDLQEMRRERLNALAEEKMSYTATLQGLTEKIKNLQEAINREKQSLGETSSRRVA